MSPAPATTTPDGTGEGTAGGAAPHARLDHVDAVRPVKQFGVVSIHSILFLAPATSAWAGGALMLLHVSREAFFFVSACMLAHANPVVGRSSMRRFYCRRAVSIAIPYACWTVIYWAMEIRPPLRLGADASALLRLILVGYYQLYYLLVIAQFYLLYPLMLRALRRAKRHPVALVSGSAALQLLLTSLMHWQLAPAWMQGYWATREITSYQFYLVAGCVAAWYLPAFEAWLYRHIRAVVTATLMSAGAAEAWFALAWGGSVSWLGSPSDPFQPIVVPFNLAAILSLYAAGRALVSRRRSERLRRWVRVGADNAYGIFLAQMIFIPLLVAIGWDRRLAFLPWPVAVTAAAAVVFAGAGALSWLLSHTRLSRGLTDQQRVPWGRCVAPVGGAGGGP